MMMNYLLNSCYRTYETFIIVVSIEFSPLSKVELTTNWYQLHNGDYQVILEHSFGKQLHTNFLQSLLDT